MIELNSRKIRTEFLIVAALFLLTGLLFSWILSNASKEFYSENVGMASEARRNPFLAAQFFIEKSGSEISLQRNFKLFDQPLNPEHTIIITNSRKPLNKRRLKAINEFISAGGHLVLQGAEVFDDDKSSSGAPIMDHIGARFYQDSTESNITLLDGQGVDEENSDEDNRDINLGESLNNIITEHTNDYTSRFQFEDFERETLVEFDSNAYLIDASGESVFQGGTTENDHILQYKQGEGYITVLSDLNFWSNKKIARADHAMFLYQLTGNLSKVWIVYNPQVDTLPQLIWQYAYFIVIAATVLLIFVIWYSQVKTGPIFSQYSTTRRQLLQHIEASADFKWRNTSLDVLLNKTRDNLIIQAKRRQRGFEQLPRNEQIDLLNSWTKLAKKQLSNALFDPPTDQWLFQEQVRTLQFATNNLYGKHR